MEENNKEQKLNENKTSRQDSPKQIEGGQSSLMASKSSSGTPNCSALHSINSASQTYLKKQN